MTLVCHTSRVVQQFQELDMFAIWPQDKHPNQTNTTRIGKHGIKNLFQPVVVMLTVHELHSSPEVYIFQFLS